jgi:hypothetical protein
MGGRDLLDFDCRRQFQRSQKQSRTKSKDTVVPLRQPEGQDLLSTMLREGASDANWRTFSDPDLSGMPSPAIVAAFMSIIWGAKCD